MKIIIETIPVSSQRYNTCGDYFYDEEGVLRIYVSETNNNFHSKLVAIHELIEQTLTEEKGIKEPDIMAHDLWVEEEIKYGNYPEDGEPGEHPKSPYRQEHILAETVERLMLNHINKETFNEYNNDLFKLFE